MKIGNRDMRWVIGFLIKNDRVLLIKRNKYPWVNKWNGAGGKIEQGETPLDAVNREILEETTINLLDAQETFFAGIVTWETNKEGDKNTGMYVFISNLSINQSVWNEERIIREGVLAWKPLEWANNKGNNEIADNIPYFLPLMMTAKKPKRYHCVFHNDKLKEVKVLPLPSNITVD